MNEEPIPDDQPFNSPDRTDEELVEYDKGVRAAWMESLLITPRLKLGDAGGRTRRSKNRSPASKPARRLNA
jgi:hypothetical protein